MKRIVGLFVLLLTCLASVALPSAADADGGSYTRSAGGVLYDDCFQHDYAYQFDVPDYAVEVDASITVLAPDGTNAAGDYVESSSGTSSFQICGGVQGSPGQWVIHADVTYYDSDYNSYSVFVPDSAFHMRDPLTLTQVHVTKKRHRLYRFAVIVKDERPNGFYATDGATERLQDKFPGYAWRTFGSTEYTNHDGRAWFRVTCPSRVLVRVVTKPDSFAPYNGSHSQPARIC